MVSLADAKQFLSVSGSDEDALIGRLVAAATAYLEQIGVTVDPEPAPVSEAILLMVSQIHRRTRLDFGHRHDETEGIGSHTLFDPQVIDAANWQVIRILTDPYREASL